MNLRLIASAGTILFVLHIFQAAANANPNCVTQGDNNGDCRISLADFEDLSACQQGPGSGASATCACFDYDFDGDIDLVDVLQFQQRFSGDNLVPGCVLAQRTDEPGALRPNPPSLPGDATWGIPQAPDAESVYHFSGEFQLTEIDLSIRGRGFDFVWARRYRSQAGSTTTMGVGWDHSYNIFLQANGGNLVLHNGDGRADEYCLDANGTWTHPEFFRRIETAGNGYRMVSHDQAAWVFNGFNGLPDDGKLTSMSDRYGNTMIFGYDVNGRLDVIHDTLHFNGNPRGIQIAYNPDGFVSSVTDYLGRQVVYDYYQNADAGGDMGDLRSVTSPTVVGTVNGNDFPTGKTTTYTYTEGFGDARLNHNLLTVTDPKGQTYLRNTYAATVNPNDLEFDRVTVQQVGDPLDLYFFFYVAETPSPANNFATARCIVNDRNGNVSESFHDHRNRLVMLRDFTGRANPGAVTTDVLNRPVNPLRPNDPPFYETRHSYNENSLLTSTLHPELNSVHYLYEGDVDYFAPQRRRCERVEVVHAPGPRGGDQSTIVETYEYDPSGNFDTGQATRAIDGRGNETVNQYDQAGNRIRTIHRIPSIVDDYVYNAFGQLVSHTHPDNGSGHRRVDTYNYYPLAAGPQYGYLQEVIIDAPGLGLTTQYEYDPAGNITRVTDPKGNDTQYVFNELDQVIQILSREVGAAGTRYEAVRFYDGNDNIVRVDVENRDEQGNLQPNTHFTTVYTYDILDYVVRTTEEASQNQTIRTQFEYDGNRNRVVIRSGEASNGNQPRNTVEHEYDERDLVFQTTRGSATPEESTDQHDYDGNGNRVSFVNGLQGVTPREHTYIYDGYDRCVATIDAMGNETLHEFDGNDNIVRTEVQGERADQAGGGSNVRLAETLYIYDEMDRVTQRDALFFDDTQSPLTDGVSSTIHVYSDSSHLLSSTDDNNHATTYVYDSVNRRSEVTDPKGNLTSYGYDANSNVTSVTETEKSDLGLADEVFVTTYTYDGLDRQATMTDSSGNTHTRAYDSRDNHTVTVDALLTETRYVYDGLNRWIGTIRDMDGDGADGDGPDISTTRVYDDNARLLQLVDDNGNATGYQYDVLDRLVAINRADGTSKTNQYDVHDNLITSTDANGTVVSADYDLLNRLTGANVVPGAGVSNDTTFQDFTYDGLSRCVRAEDDDSLVNRSYDSLSNLVDERLNGDTTSSTYDGVGNRLTCLYPSGTSLTYTYDALDRISAINNGGNPVSSYLYVGPGRVALQQYGNGTRTQFTYDGIQGVPNPPGDAGVKRIVELTHSFGSTRIDARTFTWDAMQNKFERRDVRTGGPELRHAYTLDPAYRIIGGLEEDSLGIPTRVLQYQLDGSGNRLSIGGFGGIVGPYFLDPTSPPADAQVNQYTSTPRDQRLYDDKGNLSVVVTPIGNADFVYDAYDRLVTHVDGLSGDTTDYAYDAFGRRIATTLTAGGGGLSLGCRYRYLGANVIEDLDPNGVNMASYVHGTRGSDIVCVEQGGETVYHHLDDVGNAVALSDPNGAVVERYEYDDFGVPSFFDGSGNVLGGSAFNNEYLFLGRRWNPNTGLYLEGSRYLDPFNGRALTRPEGGMWSEAGDYGNGYQDRGGNPWSGGSRYAVAGPPAGLQQRNHPACGAKISRSIDSPVTRGAGYLNLKKRRSHVTVLKLYGAAGSGSGGTDYNSSRSNNIEMAGNPNPETGRREHIGKLTGRRQHGPPRSSATDYNSSRSNKSTRSASATDHNSSRSNKTSSGIAPDHNSSRSNKTSRASATDHNSSRSNKTSSGIAPDDKVECPAWQPYRCPDGTCRQSADECMIYNVPAGVSHVEAGTGGAAAASDKCKWCGFPMKDETCNCMAFCPKHQLKPCFCREVSPPTRGSNPTGYMQCWYGAWRAPAGNHPNICQFIGAVTTGASSGVQQGSDSSGHVTVLK